MLVRVTQRGFLYWIRHPGEIFEVTEALFAKEWMEIIEGKPGDSVAPAAPTVPAAAAPVPVATVVTPVYSTVPPIATPQPLAITDPPGPALATPGAPTTMKIA